MNSFAGLSCEVQRRPFADATQVAPSALKAERRSTREEGLFSSLGRLAGGWLLTWLVAACAVAPSDPGEAVRNALAPTGKLRVGLISVPVHSVRNPYSGELSGVSHDLGRDLAARLGVPFEPIVYPNPATYVAAGQAGEWDIGSLGVGSERQALFDFAQPHLEVDYGYLVPADTRIASVSETDRPGVRVAVVARSASDLALTRDLKQASIVRGRDLTELIEFVAMSEADVIAAQKTNLYNIAPRIPGSRVLEGRPGSEEQALAIPKGRDPLALAYVREFVRDAKRRGLIQQAIDRADIRGVVVPP
jgi:polar amino acid transport system substrate-binding protein